MAGKCSTSVYASINLFIEINSLMKPNSLGSLNEGQHTVANQTVCLSCNTLFTAFIKAAATPFLRGLKIDVVLFISYNTIIKLNISYSVGFFRLWMVLKMCYLAMRDTSINSKSHS